MVALPWLAPGDPFPPADQALDDPEGLVAAGADLTVPTLLDAYHNGLFPWFSEGDPPLWWSPDPRLVLIPGEFHCSRSLRKLLRRDRFLFSMDTHFGDVIRACASVPRDGQPGTWIVEAMQAAYIALHRAGHAHSIEIWQENQLVGGLYGVRLGGVFFGESMFSRAPDASKAATAALCQLAPALDIELIDCQVDSPHLRTLGARTMPRDAFLKRTGELTGRSVPPWPRLSPTPFGNLPGSLD